MRKKPWNLIDAPVYSLATMQAGDFNMNICTYVTAVSMKPKLYAVCVYDGTKTRENIIESDLAVLQLLGKNDLSVVKHLGMKSGIHINKQPWLEKKGLLMDWEGFQVLKRAAAFMLLKKRDTIQTGDHLLCLFEVISYKTNHSDVLSLNDLREKKLIRI